MSSTTSASADTAPEEAASLFERLAEVWVELEDRLDRVPILQRLADG